MARITVEDCLEKESNRFSLVRLAAIRAKELLLGDKPVTDTKGNKAIVSALREIADGKVRFQRSAASVASRANGFAEDAAIQESSARTVEEIEADHVV
jgi:DNA-directed RNA polymerase subunit omega